MLFSILGSTILLLWFLWGLYTSSSAVDTPYKVIQKLDEFEIRQYHQQTLITTIAKDDNSAFPPLGGYIFGDNETGQKISMTTPVMTQSNNNQTEMSFILPQNYNTKNAPKPNSNDVTFSEIEARKIAVIRFSGTATDSIVKSKESLLLKYLKENNIETIGKTMLWRYNDPWTMPIMRRNEVAIEVK